MTKKLVIIAKGFRPFEKEYQWYEFEDFPQLFWIKAVSIERKTSKIRLCSKVLKPI